MSDGTVPPLSVTVDARVVSMVVARAPKVAHYWMHGFLEKSLRDHRVAWLRTKGPKFGRRGKDGNSKAIKVHRINEGPDSPRDDDVIYNVSPPQQKATSVAQAVAGLRTMGAEAFAGSTVLRVHEFGEDIRTRGKLMAVSVAKSRPKSPKAWQARYPGKKLVFRPSKRTPGEGLIYEVTATRPRGRGRPRKGASIPELREKLKLRWVLKRFVDMKPTLNFYGMWDQLRSQREQLWRGAAQRMETQLQKGDPRDF